MDKNEVIAAEMIGRFGAEKVEAAKKTITVITEIDGVTFEEAYDASKGYLFATREDEGLGIRRCCDFAFAVNLAHSLMKQITEVDPTALLRIAMQDALATRDEVEKKGA